MAKGDLKKSVIEQVGQLLRKGEVNHTQHRTLITKIELADERFLKMALDKFATIRKAAKDEDEAKKTDGAVAPAPAQAPAAAAPASAPVAKPATPAVNTPSPGASRNGEGAEYGG